MFSETDWALLQAKLTDPARATRKESAIKHLLTGFAICGACDSPRMGTIKQRGGYRAYICTACHGVARKQEPTDRHVESKIIERLSSPDLADLYGRAGDHNAATVAAARDRARELRARLASFEDEAAEGKISPAAFGRLEVKLTAQIDEADGEAQRAALPSTMRHLAGINPERVTAVWGALTIIEKRDALRALQAVVTIRPTGVGRRVFDPASVTVEFPGNV